MSKIIANDPSLNEGELNLGRAPSHIIQVLIEERKKLLQEIARIDRFLIQEGIDIKSISSGVDAHLTPWGRPRNTISKVDAIEQALKNADHPLTARELISAIQTLGYSFASANPINTLNPYLYGRKKLDTVGKLGKGFILESRRAEFESKLPSAPASQKCVQIR